ncbi:beta-1,3-galactosyltransferase 1-like [Asterias rubens]|uniref:beta-1,3-galactosyltransferase 1-like n=1 Tax=Asterias rubens TaxID=7604 RepID=UPI00145534AE|nr:beta-1,3-galactosyltransferase 1-like [Asterias rubens]
MNWSMQILSTFHYLFHVAFTTNRQGSHFQCCLGLYFQCNMRIGTRQFNILSTIVLSFYLVSWLILTISTGVDDGDQEDTPNQGFLLLHDQEMNPSFMFHRKARHRVHVDNGGYSELPTSSIRHQDNPNSTSINVTVYPPLYSEKIINPHGFEFTITNQEACTKAIKKWNMPLFLLILVKTRPEDFFDRVQIRRTWGSIQNVSNHLTLTMFLLGETAHAGVKRSVFRESYKYNDIIQENFTDAYLNLTIKNMMGLRWASTWCTVATYVASVDSDIMLNVYNLVKRLIDKPKLLYAEGSLKTNWTPYRDPDGASNKWYTPVELYPEPTYPPFFPGGCYVMSSDVASTIFKESVHVRFLPWDDVFFGLVMKRAGITPRNGEGFQIYVSLYRKYFVRKVFEKGIAVITVHHKQTMDERLIQLYESVMRKYNVTVLNSGNDFWYSFLGHIFLVVFLVVWLLSYFIYLFMLL